MQAKDYYKVLKVGRQASQEEIKAAYRKQAFEFHPDRNPSDDFADEKFKEIDEAYQVLKDPTKRSQYDAQGKAKTQKQKKSAANKRSKSERMKKDETMNFQIKRHHFYAALLPVAFLAGLAGGYFVWGRASIAAPTTTIQVTAPVDQGAAVGTQGADSNNQDISSQLAELPRYEVPVSEDDAALGPSDAPITIIEFADFQCPYCQRHAQETHPRLLEQYGDQIRFVYKDFPLSSIHPSAYSAAIAGTCALEQDKFWEFHDLLFSGRLELGRDNYLAYAAELGLDVDAFTTCFDEETYAESVQEDYNFGTDLGVSSTPTFFVNGIAVVGAQPFSLFAEIIDYELAHPSN